MNEHGKHEVDAFTYHSQRARSETLAALAAANPRVAAIHVELATCHVRSCLGTGPSEAGPKPAGSA